MCYIQLIRTKWAKPLRRIPITLFVHWKRWKSKHTQVDVTKSTKTLQINQMNLFMTCWWHQKKNERKSAYTFFWHASKLFEPFKGPVSMATRVGSVFVRVCVSSSTCCIFWCSQAPSCARGFRGQQHRLKHSEVGFFSASLHQFVQNHTRHTPHICSHLHTIQHLIYTYGHTRHL